jgi:hypothetical protein
MREARRDALAALLAVAHLGVLCSVVAFLLYARVLRGLDASSAVSAGLPAILMVNAAASPAEVSS